MAPPCLAQPHESCCDCKTIDRKVLRTYIETSRKRRDVWFQVVLIHFAHKVAHSKQTNTIQTRSNPGLASRRYATCFIFFPPRSSFYCVLIISSTPTRDRLRGSLAPRSSRAH
jgi:hypothetical protein